MKLIYGLVLCLFCLSTALLAEAMPDELMAAAEPAEQLELVLYLPLPKAPGGPVIMRQARAVQVAFSAFDPLKDPSPVSAPAKAVPASRSTPIVEAKTKETGAKVAAVAVPDPKPSPAVAKAPVVKAPVPIQRSSAPVTVKPAASPSPSPSPSTITGLTPVADPHKLAEYQQVQLPAPSPLPAPASALPVAKQEVRGAQGQTITVRLNGRGWMFTGTGKTPAGVSFMEKLVQQDAEQFRFRLDETGSLGLQFQRQDVASGLMERQVASLTVVPRGATVAPPTVTLASATTGASLYQPEYPVYQERNLPKSSAAPAPAAKSQSTGDQVINLGSAPLQISAQSVEEPMPVDAAGLLALAKRRDAAKQAGAALEIYEKLIKDFPAYGLADEVLFRMGKNLEGAGDSRNIKRAYDTYVRLQNDYPYSSWVEQAKERARYINRTYFRQ